MNNEIVSNGYFEDLRNLWKGYEVFFLINGGIVTNKMGLVILRFDKFVVIDELPLDDDERLKVQMTKDILARDKKRREEFDSKAAECKT